KGPKNPVENVSWDDAQEFARKLSQKENVTYRLPTEAEWEYACRAGTTTEYYWGDDPDGRQISDHAWYKGNLDTTKMGTAHKPVGQKKPNAWGLYDMSGNVWEWCQDWCSEYPAEKEAVNPKGPVGGPSRRVRGGSWYFRADLCRSALRSGGSPSDRDSLVGLRLVRTIQ
ncbi:MAG: formylglycine-generating enzyme family protein, partial [bacterium]|nr:formylglycine-generating enzyme family protein [bacterium]